MNAFPTRRLVVLLLAVFALAAQRSVAATAQTAPATQTTQIRITFDDTAVRELIALIEAKDTDDARLEKWLDLPANRNLLRVGEAQGDLTREQLKANLRAVIEGNAAPAGPPQENYGRLTLAPLADYKRLLDELQATRDERTRRIAAHVAAFSPPMTNVAVTVYLHVGGDWDALNRDGAIFVNVHFWHDYNRPGWDGLNMIVAHESFHTVQNAAYGNPEAQDDAGGAWLTALSKIQREGTARYVEVDTDPEPYEPFTYGFQYRAIDLEGLRGFGRNLGLLQRLYDACYPTFVKPRFVAAYVNGINAGGPYYTIGHGVAKAIDEKLGRPALIETVRLGPKDFFFKYALLCARDPSLPPLPAAVSAQVARMKERL